MSFSWKNLVGKVAPVLGAALGGPLAGVATKFIADKFIGDPDASETEIAKIMETLSPEKLAELKELDNDFSVKMKKLEVDVMSINAEDRANARLREILTGDRTPAILAFLVTVGFFGVLCLVVFFPLNSTAKSLMDIMLGSLGTVWVTAMAYYFGSSKGSSSKNALLGNNKK